MGACLQGYHLETYRSKSRQFRLEHNEEDVVQHHKTLLRSSGSRSQSQSNGAMESQEAGDDVTKQRSDSAPALPSSVSSPSMRSFKVDSIRVFVRQKTNQLLIKTSLSRQLIGSQVKEDIFKLATKDRINGILAIWDVRGAERPITDFYQKVSTLGEGAFGTVQRWRYRQKVGVEGEDADVAVKHIKWQHVWHGLWRDKELEESVRNELFLLLALDHPFIVKFREWFEEPFKGLFIVMELCEGRSLQCVLDEVCRETSVDVRYESFSFFRRMFRELAYAISYIHNMEPPVIHRDLKPDNVLLKGNHEHSCIKVIDFGLAAIKDYEAKGAHFQVGTMLFMAPELFLTQRGQFTEYMDNWALGIILVWMMTAIHLGSLQHPMLPLEEGEGFRVRYMDLFVEYRSKVPWHSEFFDGMRSTCSPDLLRNLVGGILQYPPEDRLTAAAMLHHDWLHAMDPAVSAAVQVLRTGGMLRNLQTYRDLSVLEKKILHLIADHAGDEQVLHLRRTFRALDTDMSGRLSKQELLDGFHRNEVKISDQILEELFLELEDGGDSISYNEWLAATVGTKVVKSAKAMAAAFRVLDSSGTGDITFTDLSKALGDDHEAEEVINGRTGAITFKEFKGIVDEIASKRFRVMSEVNI